MEHAPINPSTQAITANNGLNFIILPPNNIYN